MQRFEALVRIMQGSGAGYVVHTIVTANDQLAARWMLEGQYGSSCVVSLNRID